MENTAEQSTLRQEIDKYKTEPRKIVEQLEYAGYENIGGKLEANIAFVALKELIKEGRI